MGPQGLCQLLTKMMVALTVMSAALLGQQKVVKVQING